MRIYFGSFIIVREMKDICKADGDLMSIPSMVEIGSRMSCNQVEIDGEKKFGCDIDIIEGIQIYQDRIYNNNQYI